jgi:glycosyltransferase involved in cell wall biosynthesis
MKFILIDNSIIDVGGHHYEYAMHVLRAAEKAGYTPILATNRRFKANDQSPWRIYPVYKYGFWFRLAEPLWYRLAKKFSSAIQRSLFSLKIKLIFSTMGFFASIRNQMGEYLRRQIPNISFAVVFYALAWYGYRIVHSFLVFLWSIFPFQDYLRRLFGRLKAFIRVIFSPIILLFRSPDWMSRWLADYLKMRQFGKDTWCLFRQVRLENGDIVFIPTLSHVEMLGLLRYLKKDPGSTQATWHLLFRRNLYSGREPDYAAQDEALRPIRNAFFQFLENLPTHKVYFYTDTEELTAQYNRLLGVKRFKTLPIPHTYPPLECLQSDRRPLRVIYVGDARAEKGYHHLPRIVQDLWADYVETGKVIFVFQSNYNTPEGEPEAIVARSQLECYPKDKVILVKEPLSSEEYWKLLSSGDINLLLYDRDNYYARSSGIFIESLALGVPVIVPAGTWMARQLADEIYRYHVSLMQKMEILKFRRGDELRWRRHGQLELNPMLNGELTFGGADAKAFCWLAVPKGATHLLVFFKILTSNAFVEVLVDQLDKNNNRKRANAVILSHGVKENFASTLVPLERDIVLIWLGFCNAFSNLTTIISNVQIAFLRSDAFSQKCPLSVVGLIYNHPDEISDCVREMVDHYEHYRATAQKFARKVYQRHCADELIKEIVSTKLSDVPMENGGQGNESKGSHRWGI